MNNESESEDFKDTLKNFLFFVIARSVSDEAISNLLIYLKARLLRFARNDNFWVFQNVPYYIEKLEHSEYFTLMRTTNNPHICQHILKI